MSIQTGTAPTWSIKADLLCVHCRSRPVISENPETTHTLTKALNSIFKLNYLTAYNLLRKESLTEEMELLSFCPSCQKVLFDLEQLYENFLQLGQLDSYLLNQIRRVDEIMDSRLHEKIEDSFMDNNTNDDVVKEEENESNMSFDEDTSPNSPIQEQSQSPSSSTHSNDNNLMESKVNSTLPQVFQPRVILIRLPQKYCQLPVVNSKPDKNDDDSNTLSSEEGEKERRGRVKSGHVSKSSKSRTKVTTKKKKSQKPLTRQKGKKNSTSHPKKRQKDMAFYYNARTDVYLYKRTRFPYPCWYCNKEDFQSPAECIQHTRTEHVSKLPCPSSSGVVCDRCAKICLGESVLRRHLIECEKIPVGVLLPNKYQCPHCPKSFAKKFGLQTHLMTHNTEKPFHCDLCEYKTKIPNCLRIHKQTHHEKAFTQQQKFHCDECPSILKSEALFKIHKYHMHTTEGFKKYREYQVNVLARKKEMRDKNGPKSTLCDDCNVDFYSRMALINHRRSAHNDTTMNVCMCPTCGKSFTASRTLLAHIRTVHSDNRNEICEFCGMAFKQKEGLKNHIKYTHTEEGRLEYNRKTRERNQRRKLLAQQLANMECRESR